MIEQDKFYRLYFSQLQSFNLGNKQADNFIGDQLLKHLFENIFSISNLILHQFSRVNQH